MTEPERKVARALIDQATRERLLREGEVCAYCFVPFEPTSPTQKYCCSTHRKAAWQRTAAGRRVWIENRRRRSDRKRRARLSSLTSTAQAA